MAASRGDIGRWLRIGKQKKATHMIVVCDEWDWEDYPVYILEGQDVYDVYREHNGQNMERVMEVYSFSLDIEKQLAERRAFHFE